MEASKNINVMVSPETVERKNKLGKYITWKHIILSGLTRYEIINEKNKKARGGKK